jgi:hypothetical protein
VGIVAGEALFLPFMQRRADDEAPGMAVETQRIGLFQEEKRFRAAVRDVAVGAETGADRAVDPETLSLRLFRRFRRVTQDTKFA